mgnify:FL=1
MEGKTLHAQVILNLMADGYDKATIAKMAGLSSPRMLDYTLRGDKQISRKALERLALSLGTSVPALYEKVLRNAGEEDQAYQPEKADAQDFTYVPLKAARPKCGLGGEQTSGDIVTWMAFRREWLYRRGNASKMSLFKVVGDSMSPTLENNDLILVDESQRDPIEGCLFLVLVNGQLMVKRVSMRPDVIEFISDNPQYTRIQVSTSDESSQVILFGRVLWVGRDL